MVLFTKVKRDDLKILLDRGFYLDQAKKYESLRYKGHCTVILFDSGKLLIQGRDEAVKAVRKIIEDAKIAVLIPEIRFKEYHGTYIGSDECMKGDTFGGIVVAGLKANDRERQELKQLGVVDSKKLKDEEIIIIADQIKNKFKNVVYSLTPKQYNSKTKNKSITELLNELHEMVFTELSPGKHVVDKYPGCKVGDISEVRAEEKYVEVAAASILARASCLEQFEILSRKAGFKIPKGSTHVENAVIGIRKSNLPLEEFLKLNFKNVSKFLINA